MGHSIYKENSDSRLSRCKIVQNLKPFQTFTLNKISVVRQDFESHEKYTSGTIVRGIKHTNRIEGGEDCVPEVLLIDGGINEERAIVKITSPRGCGLDSLVEFFVEQY